MLPIWRGSIAGVEFTVHTAGDIDEVPSDPDKNVPAPSQLLSWA
jgi:hypothetical protein